MMQQWPKVILGTSTLGNLYQDLSQTTKTAIIKAFLETEDQPAFFDSAGKYGAGLALESLAKGLKELAVDPSNVLISNKLGWYRTELRTPEPTFEPGVWKNLANDAIQKMGYEGILECYEQGNQLLDGYRAQLVSVHDPDEYLAKAESAADEEKRFKEILQAYDALFALRNKGEVLAVGIGAKDWRIIQRLVEKISLDWVMFANSMTVHDHPTALWQFMKELEQRGIPVINSAVFNGGFLTGADFYNYKHVDPATEWGRSLFAWREKYNRVCMDFGVSPVAVALQFGRKAPGIKSIAISSSNPARVKETMQMAGEPVPAGIWQALQENGLITIDLPELL